MRRTKTRPLTGAVLPSATESDKGNNTAADVSLFEDSEDDDNTAAGLAIKSDTLFLDDDAAIKRNVGSDNDNDDERELWDLKKVWTAMQTTSAAGRPIRTTIRDMSRLARAD